MTTLKVMIYNMHHGIGIDGQPNLERIADLAKASGADVIGFNEVDRFFAKRSGFVDQFGWFCGQLGMHCAFGASITRKKGAVLREYGNAIFSRLPIVSQQNHGLRARGLAISEPRAILEAEIDVGHGQTVTIYLTHLSIIKVLRKIQMDLIVKRIGEENRRTVLMGDMNMISGAGTWRKITGILDDATHRAHGAALRTFPSLQPITQKDYIFISKSIQVDSVEIITKDRYASDHLPLLATLNIEE